MGALEEMIVAIDSNIFLSALLSPAGSPAKVFEAWQKSRFRLATCMEQLDEIRRASRYTKFQSTLKPHLVGKMIHTLQGAEIYEIRRRHQANDPFDAYLLDLAEASEAHYLVTGDKRSGLLSKPKVGTTRILTAAVFCKRVLREM